jgi:formamidase
METLFHIEPGRPLWEQPVPGHNRWHPDIPAAASVRPGSSFRIECAEWTDYQIGRNADAREIAAVNLNRGHSLSGPIAVEGAEPGDILVVEILDIGTLSGWGYTGIFSKENGGGFLTDYFPDAHKALWDFSGIYASSEQIPRVRFAGLTHPGLIGCAPSHELLAEWNRREAPLVAENRVPPLALPPLPEDAVLGTLTGAERDRVAKEACRTIPPREHGGNCDIKNLSRGTRIYFPVYVDGAKLSMGDLHFSQGDGEITFCGAIEMDGWIDLGVDLIKGGVAKYGLVNPIFKPGPVEPRYESYLVFEGICVEDGKNYYMDATVAFRRAAMNAIEYLKRFGFTGEQAYLLLGSAPIEGRIGGIVDIPNCVCTISIPTEIFDFDILPS